MRKHEGSEAPYSRQWLDRAAEAFRQLLLLDRAGDYGRTFLEQLEVYEKLNPDTAEGHYWLARCLHERGEMKLALAQAREAYERRGQQPLIWQFLAKLLAELGEERESYFFQALALAARPDDESLELPEQQDRRRLLQELKSITAPFQVKYRSIFSDNDQYGGHLVGQFLDSDFLGQRSAGYREWCGIYNPHGWREARSVQADLCELVAVETMGYTDSFFDIMKVQLATEVRLSPPPGVAAVVPVAGTERCQAADFSDGQHGGEVRLPRYEFDFYRFSEPLTIRSARPMAIGEPVLMRHDEGRLRLVLNILTDGLSWKQMQKENFRRVPNIRRFFASGLTFGNHYAVAEYTYPALAAIQTSQHLHHGQIFHNNRWGRVRPGIATLSEKMKELGYYCVTTIGEPNGIYNGALRGFDRKIIQGVYPCAYEGVDRTMRFLEAFGETDAFVFLHVTDSHPYNASVPPAVQAEARVPWYESLEQTDDASVFLSSTPMSLASNGATIEMMDRHLGTLFRYLEEHYQPEEYLVCLYSDHGASIYSDPPYLLSEEQAGSAFMLRGAGVPSLGDVEELTSALDIMPSLARMVGFEPEPYWDGQLPAALGGRAREYVISNSLFPGQTYKLCIRTQAHEFRLETAEPTREDGTVDLSAFETHIYTRDAKHEEIEDPALQEFFMCRAVRHMKSFCHGLDEHTG